MRMARHAGTSRVTAITVRVDAVVPQEPGRRRRPAEAEIAGTTPASRKSVEAELADLADQDVRADCRSRSPPSRHWWRRSARSEGPRIEAARLRPGDEQRRQREHHDVVGEQRREPAARRATVSASSTAGPRAVW